MCRQPPAKTMGMWAVQEQGRLCLLQHQFQDQALAPGQCSINHNWTKRGLRQEGTKAGMNRILVVIIPEKTCFPFLELALLWTHVLRFFASSFCQAEGSSDFSCHMLLLFLFCSLDVVSYFSFLMLVPPSGVKKSIFQLTSSVLTFQ